MRYSELCDMLKSAKIDNYAREAAILIEEICGELSPDTDYCSKRLEDAARKRCTGYPLQYIIGKWWFCRCEFELDESCLVPRPDTECVLEEGLKLLPKDSRFADLCTGSGCIAISMLDLRKDISGVAVELYPKTLEIARKNAEKNRVSDRIAFIEGDVLSGNVLGDVKFALIISNPPYIQSEVVDSLTGEVTYEPRTALDGGEDGLIFYRAIVEGYSKNLCDGGYFVFEIGYDQADDIKKIAMCAGFDCRVVKDLGGNDRTAILSKQMSPV